MLIASFWGPFILGVAVTVVSGVILGIIFGGWKRLTEGKTKREHKQYDRYINRSAYRAGLNAVASELKDCAFIAQRCEEGQGHVPELARGLPIQEWGQRRGEMMYLRDEDKATWDELEETYRLLRDSKQTGGYPAKSVDLLALSARLTQKLEQEGKPPEEG